MSPLSVHEVKYIFLIMTKKYVLCAPDLGAHISFLNGALNPATPTSSRERSQKEKKTQSLTIPIGMGNFHDEVGHKFTPPSEGHMTMHFDSAPH